MKEDSPRMNNVNKIKKPKEKNEMAVLSKSYLVLYNGIQTVGWSYILYKTCSTLIRTSSPLGLWKECGKSLMIFQTLAALEVLHCIVRIVPSNAIVTFAQVASRVFQVWGIMYSVEKAQDTPFFALTCFAWGLTEVIRYSYYFTSLIGKTSNILTWCRYSFFLFLYPAGVTGEMGNVFYALDTIKRTKLYSLTLPNIFNISFNYYYYNIFLVLSYIPLFPQMFNHMLRQRKKVLGRQPKKMEIEKEN